MPLELFRCIITYMFLKKEKVMKKPIYLYILVGLSLLLSLLGLYATMVPSTPKSAAAYEGAGIPEDVVKQLVDYTAKNSEFVQNPLNKILAILSLIVIIAALVFLIRKNIVYANLTYLAYLVISIIGIAYSYIGASSLLNVLDAQYRKLVSGGLLISTVVMLVINLIFLGLVLYKFMKQQKELEKDELG